MEYTFSELVDVSNLQNFLDGLFSMPNPVLAILDNNSNVLVSFGWQEICLKYHRINNETALLCRKSDGYIKNHLESNEPYICYTCANGLVDAAAPIIIEGEHVATVFHGQFLLNEPDIEQFRKQARRYGFNEEEYIKVLAKVPIYLKEELDSIMLNIRRLVETMAQNGLARLRLIESKSEERLKVIINNTPHVAIQSYDVNGRILYFNKASESMFGLTRNDGIEKKLNKPIILDKKMGYNFCENLKDTNQMGKVIKEKEWVFKNKDGIEKTIHSTLFPINFPDGKKEFISMDIDVTEVKRLEKEIQRLDRLNLIGETAAGIAHEIRNPMTTVRGFLQMFEEEELNSTKKGHLNLMIQELDRANAIISEFLSLARNKSVDFKIMSLNSLIESICPLIFSDAIKADKEISLDLGNIPKICLDEKEIRQLILNLVRNGFDAMLPGGTLYLKTYLSGKEVIFEVKDGGCGIPEDVIEKIGQPFVTTKDNGTGLGLSVCYSICQRHNAKMNFKTSPEGTIFYIKFSTESGDGSLSQK